MFEDVTVDALEAFVLYEALGLMGLYTDRGSKGDNRAGENSKKYKKY